MEARAAQFEDADYDMIEKLEYSSLGVSTVRRALPATRESKQAR